MSIQFPKDFKGVQENPAIIQLTSVTENTEQPIQMAQSEALSSANVDEFSSESGQEVEAEEGVDIGKLFQDFLKSLDVNEDGKISTDEVNGVAKTEENKETERVSEPGSVEEKVDELDKTLSEITYDVNCSEHNAAISSVLKDLKGQDLVDFIEAYDAKHGEGSFVREHLREMQWGPQSAGKQAEIDFDTTRRNLLKLKETHPETYHSIVGLLEADNSIKAQFRPISSPGDYPHQRSDCTSWLLTGWHWL